MDVERDERQAREDAELEREIRSRRKFSLAEAIGREGGDLLKGASPVTRKRQAELEIGQYLTAHLADAEGALGVVLLRWVVESDVLLEEAYERPLEALGEVTRKLLSGDERLRRFVAKVDSEWGRLYLEPPRFEKPGSPPDPEDPYTLASVRAALGELLAGLEAGVEGGPP